MKMKDPTVSVLSESYCPINILLVILRSTLSKTDTIGASTECPS